MSPRRPKRRRTGCWVETTPGGKLRLRFWAHVPGVGRHRFGETTDLDDTVENRKTLGVQAALIGAEIRAGRFDYLAWFPNGSKAAQFRAPTAAGACLSNSTTVREYYDTWIAWKEGERVRRSRLRDYRFQFKHYILPILGDARLEEITLLHLRDLQMQLRKRKKKSDEKSVLSEKTVKNVILGSLKALMRDAGRDGLNIARPFAELEWEEPVLDDPNPFTVEERDHLLRYFRTKTWKFRGYNETRPHYAYFAFLFTLFFTGCRPSELSALRVGDFDPTRATLRVRRSRNLHAEAAPKTRSARRTVRLVPENVGVLEQLVELEASPDDYLFTNVHGEPIDASNFAELFRRAQRALGIGLRKLYATKHTYVSLALTRGVNLAWLSEQTGVAATTLLKHYGKFIHTPDADRVELAKIEVGTGTFSPRLAHETGGPKATPRYRDASGMSPTGFEPGQNPENAKKSGSGSGQNGA